MISFQKTSRNECSTNHNEVNIDDHIRELLLNSRLWTVLVTEKFLHIHERLHLTEPLNGHHPVLVTPHRIIQTSLRRHWQDKSVWRTSKTAFKQSTSLITIHARPPSSLTLQWDQTARRRAQIAVSWLALILNESLARRIVWLRRLSLLRRMSHLPKVREL